MMFLECPAYLDQYGAPRCGLPAEVSCRFTMHSTDGPVESAMISCPAGHHFCGPIESLTWNGKDKHDPGSAAATSRAGHDSAQGSHHGRHGAGRSPTALKFGISSVVLAVGATAGAIAGQAAVGKAGFRPAAATGPGAHGRGVARATAEASARAARAGPGGRCRCRRRGGDQVRNEMSEQRTDSYHPRRLRRR